MKNETWADIFPEETKCIYDFKEKMKSIPPILATNVYEIKVQGRIYKTGVKILRPYSEFQVSSEGLYPMGFDYMYQQALANLNKSYIHGWMTDISQEGSIISTNWVLSTLSDHEHLAGAMLLAGFTENSIVGLYKYGTKIPVKNSEPDTSVLLSLDKKGNEVEYFPWRRGKQMEPKTKKIVNLKLSRLAEAISPQILDFISDTVGTDFRQLTPKLEVNAL